MQSQLNIDRGKLRMERLRQLELEQLQWEQEALVMPEDLNRALFLSFESVKTEFSDLDGLSWSRYPVPLVTNPWALEEPTPRVACADIERVSDTSDTRTPTFPHSRPPQKSHARVDMQDTVRVSRLAQPSRSPLQPANQFFSTTSHKDPQGSPYACHSLRHPRH